MQTLTDIESLRKQEAKVEERRMRELARYGRLRMEREAYEFMAEHGGDMLWPSALNECRKAAIMDLLRALKLGVVKAK